jgi:hypothetical protein
MNFFDTYDIARAPTPQPSDANQPSLNEEFNEVVGQLGRFWGGFKRQVSALVLLNPPRGSAYIQQKDLVSRANRC